MNCISRVPDPLYARAKCALANDSLASEVSVRNHAQHVMEPHAACDSGSQQAKVVDEASNKSEVAPCFLSPRPCWWITTSLRSTRWSQAKYSRMRRLEDAPRQLAPTMVAFGSSHGSRRSTSRTCGVNTRGADAATHLKRDVDAEGGVGITHPQTPT